MRDAAIDTHRSPARGAGRSRAAGAPPLDDMVGEGPVSRGAPRRGGITSAAVAAQRLGGGRLAARGHRGPNLMARLRGRLPRIRPLKALTVGAFAVALVGIVANAMVFQRGHHPSPLFGLGRSVDGAPDAGARTAAAVPAPAVPAPVERTGTIPAAPAVAVDPAPPAAAAAAAPKPAPAHHAAKVRHEEAGKAKPAEAAAVAHPRPGHAAPAHARAQPKPVEPKPVELKSSEPKAAKAETKADPVAKVLAGGAHPAKPAAGKPSAKPDVKPVGGEATHPARTAAAPPAHPHHRLAATAQAAKPAAEAE